MCNESLNVLFNIFNKMNSNLAYFDMSHNIEILHLNDSNEFENEINKQLEKKIEPVDTVFCLPSICVLVWAQEGESPPSFCNDLGIIYIASL